MSRVARVRPVFALGVVLAAAACGTITIDWETDVGSLEEISHDIRITVAGPIVELMEEGETTITDIEELEALGWDVSMTEDEIDGVKSITMNVSGGFTGEDALRVASGELGVEDSAIGELPIVTVTETEDEFLYRITFGPTVTDSAGVEPVESDSFVEAEGLDLSGLEDFVAASLSELLDFTWTVRFPGKLVESNATSTSGNRATWELNFTEVASEDELYIVSRVSKNQGGGSCSAPAQAYERG